jgi:hypothetical protein
MVRSAPLIIVLATLLPALAGEAPVHDPAVARLLGDGAGAPLQVTINLSADLRAGGRWRCSNSRSVLGPATAPFRAEMKLGAEADAPEVRAEVRLEDGLVVYDLTCLAPIPIGKNSSEEFLPPGRNSSEATFRAVARGACSTFGELAVLPVPGAGPGGEVRIGAYLSVCDARDRDLFPPDGPGSPAPPDRTIELALRDLPAGAGLPGEARMTAAAADAFLRDAGAREVRRLSLRLAPGVTGSLESLVERSCLADFDVEVAQSPTIPIYDPVPGAVPAGLAARVIPDAEGLTLDWTYTAVLAMEEVEATLGYHTAPVRVELPALGTTGGRFALRQEAALLPLAALADGGTLILDAR